MRAFARMWQIKSSESDAARLLTPASTRAVTIPVPHAARRLRRVFLLVHPASQPFHQICA